jgi:pyrimidine-nucleoside phosphorylase
MPTATAAPVKNIVGILDHKRLGGVHSADDLTTLVDGATDGSVPDYQLAAWLMAACINGLNVDETTWLTDAMAQSGTTLNLAPLKSSPDVVFIDKHSTGGVGDKVTLIVLPLLACCEGVKLVKLSGRGLGFTGGTIDKLEAIPDFKTAMTIDDMLKQVQHIGAVISSQTGDLAPADGKLYALRDVTATVESIPLIAASVMSKKIAAGADVIVLDIKAGAGAFMKTREQAQALADMCQQVGERLGKPVVTHISSMDQPLGLAIGHTLEVIEAIQTLQGNGPKDVEALCLKLGAMALVAAKKFDTEHDAQQFLHAQLHNGAAFAKFRDMVIAQGGDPEALEHFHLMPQPERIHMVPAPQSGTITHIDPLAMAKACKVMGGGRQTKADAIHLGVGVLLHKQVGDTVTEGETLLELYGGDHGCDEALALVKGAVTIQ